MGLFAMLLRWLTPVQAAACAAAALLFNVFFLHRLTNRSLLREHERGRGFSAGIVVYPAVVLVLILVFPRRLELAAAAWALLAFGDAMATVAGVTLRGPRLPWNPEKSWAGFLAFILYGACSSALLLRWVQRGAVGAGEWVGDSFFVASPGNPWADVAFLVGGCLAASVAAGFAESLRTGLDDNVVVPLVGAAALYAGTLVEPARLVAGSSEMVRGLAVGAGVNALLAMAAYALRGVGPSGAVSGWILGTALFGFGGWRSYLILFSFVVLGTVCTRTGRARKAALGIAQEAEGRRGASNAVANVLAGVVFAFLATATPHRGAFLVAMVAAFATASADTVSSEIGQAFGRRHYLVTTLRRVPAGTDGAVSVEGTVAGILGSAAISALAWGLSLIPPVGAAIVVAAAFVGTTVESYLGATVERAKIVDNEVVNFTNTMAGGLAALGLLWLTS